MVSTVLLLMERMDGWMDGKDGWMDGWMDGKDGWMIAVCEKL